MIAFDEAFGIVAATARPLGEETVPLAAAHRRVLAADVVARLAAPRADVSAMDGYAIRDAELATTARFRVIGAAYPGAGIDRAIGAGEAVRIFTGAPLPPGADRVVVQEDVRREDDAAIVEGRLTDNHHVRTRGSDFAAGDTLLAAGHVLDPRSLVAAAGADLAELRVWRRPGVALLGTGDELVAPGDAAARPGCVPESVSFGVGAIAEAWGAELVSRRRVGDELETMTAAVADAAGTADVVVLTGGASVGEKDFARRAIVAAGGDLLFAKVAILPGKPVWFARIGTRLVIGLPGNPTSAMVTARLFLAPLLAALGGRDARDALCWRRMALAAPIGPTGDREAFLRARREADGVHCIVRQQSNMQRALVDADLLVRRRPHAPAAAAGETVDVLDF